MLQVSPQFSPMELCAVIELERRLHPLARLQDYFKLLNQAFFGPTHINPDPAAIAAFLRAEMDSLTGTPDSPCQDIGSGKGFLRYQLRQAMAGLEVETLTQCLLDSRCADASALAGWPSLWRDYWPLVAPHVSPTAEETDLISRCLVTGSLPSHSAIYREAYQPHYRVIHGSLAQRLAALNKDI